jgi:primosomal protein N' (replication factor Y)
MAARWKTAELFAAEAEAPRASPPRTESGRDATTPSNVQTRSDADVEARSNADIETRSIADVVSRSDIAAEERDVACAEKLFADVAVNRPVRCEFTYRVPDSLRSSIAPGARVVVPLGPRREVGVVVALRSDAPIGESRLKTIARSLDRERLIDAELLELTRWISAYYACSWGEALSAVLPSALKRESERRGVTMAEAERELDAVAVSELERSHPKQFRMLRTLREIGAPIELRDLCRRLNLSDGVARSLRRKGFIRLERINSVADPLATSTAFRKRPKELSADQELVLSAIVERIAAGSFEAFLLQGVTGSGKTEVYLRVIEHALALGKGAIVIVPEIALTPQTVGWFRSRFGEIAVLHSRMTDAQRLQMWMAVKLGRSRVVVGARSAVFAPVANLGVIVVDEEHEPSFKQEANPRYHARDVAVVRAKSNGAVCILGSATPSLESWTNAKKNRYRHLLLRERVSGGRLPHVEIVDMRAEKPDGKPPLLFSQRLKTLLRQAFERKEQSILFLNRRGFAPTLWCSACGETARCAQCDVALTYHRRIKRVICHSCCEELAPPKTCPTCTAPALRYLGAGSERIEAALSEILPTARVRRMDSDTMLRREDYETVLESFGRGEVDVLVGTQMIAKGLDFPRVSVVGVVSAESSLHLPDFRASERTFQLLSQVSGRAGRGDVEGRIVVQTTTPAHPAILFAAQHDYDGFAAAESRLRGELGYPPHGKLMRIVFDDKEESRVADLAGRCAEMLRASCAADGITVLGPAEAPIGMLRGRHRRHLLIKSPAGSRGLARVRDRMIELLESTPRPRMSIDVDPVSML